MQLTDTLADEVLACSIRYYGNDRQRTAIDAAEIALTDILKQSSELKKRNLGEPAKNIKQAISSRSKQWRKKLDLIEKMRKERPNAEIDSLVFLG